MDCTCRAYSVTGREFLWFIVGHMISNPNYEEDFVPQNVPMKEGEEVLHH
jgi:hypothetical protein